MGVSLRRWRAGHLLTAWGVCWLVLLLVGTDVERSIALMTMLLWIAGPPLLLGLAWILTRPRRMEAGMASSLTRT